MISASKSDCCLQQDNKNESPIDTLEKSNNSGSDFEQLDEPSKFKIHLIKAEKNSSSSSDQ